MRIDRCLHFATVLVIFGGVSGCQLLQGFELERKYDLAQADDAACEERGYSFPGIAYTECRMDLHDKRLREQWMELQMSLQHGAQTEQGTFPQQRTAEPYRPLRIQDYRCELRRNEESLPWIHCFEDAKTRHEHE